MAEDKKELDSMTETIKNIANGSMCQIELHYYQQKEALNTVLPIGGRQVETMSDHADQGYCSTPSFPCTGAER